MIARLLTLAALAAVLLPGCYDDHGRYAGPTPVHPHDGGPDAPFVEIFPDAGPPPPMRRDGGLALDAPASCPLVRADATCLESFAMPAGVPFELPFLFDGCACCAATSCDVTVDAASRTLRLGTHLCPDPCDCDACNTPRGSCSVPALPFDALGQWTVEVNGTDAFVIGVVDTFDPTVGPSGCATYAEPDDCGATPDFTTGPIHTSCVRYDTLPDRDVLRFTPTCWSCGELDSSCEVIVTPRLTDDFPPGGNITLHAARYVTSCDLLCVDVCVEHERECALPPLLPGGFYRVFVDGVVVASFTEGAPTACPGP